MVVLMWLERIDPRLPGKVSATFAHQMVDNTSLRDLQPTICARIPALLQELDETEANRAAIHAADAAPIAVPTLAASSFRGKRFRGRGRGNFQKNRSISKFCRICFLLNKGSPHVYTSHNITTCSKLSDRDKQDMARHAAAVLEESDDPDTPQPIPGWDVDDDNQSQ